MGVCVCVVSVIIKRPVLPPCVVVWRSKNPLYLFIYFVNSSSVKRTDQDPDTFSIERGVAPHPHHVLSSPPLSVLVFSFLLFSSLLIRPNVDMAAR